MTLLKEDMPNNPLNLGISEPSDQNLTRAAQLVLDIYRLLQNAATFREFATGKGDSRDGCHRLRLFHDKFFLDAFQNRCSGTLYRSEAVAQSKVVVVGSGATETLVHCEHAIPASLLVRYLFERWKGAKPEELGEFLFFHQFVCCVSKMERKQLDMRRTYGGKNRVWSCDHPNFLRGEILQILPQSSNSSAALGNVLMFARYENTGIKVLMAPSGKLVDMDSYTVNDHVEATRSAFAKTWGRFHDRMTHVVQQSVAGDVRPASQSSRT